MNEHNPIIAIQKLGIPTHSYIAAAVAAGDLRQSTDLTKYNEMITLITNDGANYTELPIAQMVFGYLVQEHVRNFAGTNQLNKDEVERLAVNRATEFVQREPWHWSTEEDPEQRVSNKEIAVRLMKLFDEDTERSVIIQAIVDRLDVSEATAASYIRSAVKEDVVQVKTEAKPKINKKAAALEIVRANPTLDKKTLINMISTQLDTTPAGAQTYYYASIKELKIEPSAPTTKRNTKSILAELFNENPAITRQEFIAAAGTKFNVQANTAQSYYYALIKERKAGTTSQ